MSLSQTSDQRPVSTENQLDASVMVENQETSFGESIASLLENQNLLGFNGFSVNEVFNCIGTEDIQSHLSTDQDPYSRIEALYNQLAYSLELPGISKDYDHLQRQLSVPPPRSTSLSTVATSISLAASMMPINLQDTKAAQVLPLLMSECQFAQSPLHHEESFQLVSEKSRYLNPLLVNNGTPVVKNASRAAPDGNSTIAEKFCPKFSYPTNFATIASSPLFGKNFVLNSNSETLSERKQIEQRETDEDSTNPHLGSCNVFPYYLQSHTSKLDELRESLNMLPCYGLPSSQFLYEQSRDASVISNSSISYAALATVRRNGTEETPTPLRCPDQMAIPSSPIAKAIHSKQVSLVVLHQGEECLSSEESEETSLARFAYVPLYNVHNMVYPIIFTFIERKQDFISYVEQFINEKTEPLPSSSRPTRYIRRPARCHSPTSSEIYDIGPKILPIPFSKDFVALKKTRFKPLWELKTMPQYQLPKNQTCNYMIDKMKKKPHCPNRPASGGLGAFRLQPPPLSSLGEAKNDRYYSRLNIYELSKILELDQYDIEMTKFIEGVILEIFGNYCDFKLGLQTWIRDTDKEKRKSLIQQLYSYSSIFYPELDQFKLEVIIRRGSYSMMQTRLRRERRLQKVKK